MGGKQNTLTTKRWGYNYKLNGNWMPCSLRSLLDSRRYGDITWWLVGVSGLWINPPRFIRSSWVQPLAVHDGWTGQMAILGSCQRIQEPHPISGALVEVPSSKVYKTCPDCAFSMFFSNPPSSGYPVEAAQFNWVDLSKNQRAIDHRAMRSIAMESGEMEDAAPLIQEPAAKSTKALLAMTGGRWWRMARVFPQLVGYFLTPYPDNFWYVYTYTVYIYTCISVCVRVKHFLI